MKIVLIILIGCFISIGLFGCETTQSQTKKSSTVVTQKAVSETDTKIVSCILNTAQGDGNGDESAMGSCPCGCGTAVPKALLTATDTTMSDSCCAQPEEKKNDTDKK